MPKVPKYKVCISLQYLQKNMGNEVVLFLPPDKYDFYKVVISFWMCVTRLTQSTKITSFQYLWKRKKWSWFFACRKTSKISSNWYYHFRCVWPGMPKLPKITIFLFRSNTLRKKWVMKLIFYMQIRMKFTYNLILWLLMGMIKHSQSSENRKFAMSLQYLENEVRNEVGFCMQINIQISYKLISKLWAWNIF